MRPFHPHLPHAREPHADRRLEARLGAAATDFRERPSDGFRERVLARIDASEQQQRTHSPWRARLALAATITILLTLATRFVPNDAGPQPAGPVPGVSPTAIAAALPDRLGVLANESSSALQRRVSQPLRSELDALAFDASNLAEAIFGRMTKPLRSLVAR